MPLSTSVTQLAKKLYSGRAGNRLTDFARDNIETLLEVIVQCDLAIKEISSEKPWFDSIEANAEKLAEQKLKEAAASANA